MQLSRLFFTVSIMIVLCSCGDPSVVAFARGQYFASKARTETRHRDYLSSSAKSDYESAIDQFSAALKLKPKAYATVYQRALCYQALHQDEPCLTDFSQAIALQPKSWEAWKGKAELEERIGEFERAVDDFSQALSLVPAKDSSRFELTLARASCEADCQRYQQALEDCHAALSKRPHSAAATVQKAVTEWCMGKTAEGLSDFAKAISLSPHWPMCRQVRGYYEFSAGDYKAAAVDFEKSLNLTRNWDAEEPFYAVIYASQAYRLQNRDPEANALLEKCTEGTELPIATADGAENAAVAEHWPAPAVQFLRRDIGKTQLIKAAGTDRNKLTEVHCYIALDAVASGRQSEAKEHFNWILKNGNRGFVEFHVAKSMDEKFEAVLTKN